MKAFPLPKSIFLCRTLVATILIFFLFIPASQAQKPHFYLINYWVEDGFIFHVTLATTPSNAMCALKGEGLIEIEVQYRSNINSQLNTEYGFAIWYPSPRAGASVLTEAEAMGPLCTKRSPCRIQNIKLSGLWCPPNNGSLEGG